MRKGILLATVAGFAAMVGTGSVNAADKLKVGVTATLEGTYTVLGEDGMRGYDLGVEAHGGKAGGKEIETIVGSTDASPDSAIRAAKIPFVLLDPQFYPGLKDAARYEQYVQIIDDTGQSSGAAVFARYAMMKEWEAQSDSLLRAMLSKDAFHMSDRGYGCLAQNLAADLAPRLHQVSTEAIDNSAAAVSIIK